MKTLLLAISLVFIPIKVNAESPKCEIPEGSHLCMPVRSENNNETPTLDSGFWKRNELPKQIIGFTKSEHAEIVVKACKMVASGKYTKTNILFQLEEIKKEKLLPQLGIEVYETFFVNDSRDFAERIFDFVETLRETDPNCVLTEYFLLQRSPR